MRQWLLLTIGAVSVTACSTTPLSIPATLTLNAVSGNNQIASGGAVAAAPLIAQVVSASGGAPGITLSASSDTRFCTVSPASASTDSGGNASFTVTALNITGVNCTTSLAVVGQPTSRGAVNFNTAIRPAQRTLGVVAAPALPSASVAVTDAGAAAGSVTISAASNLPAPDANHTYGVYIAKQDGSGNVSGVTLLGKTSSFPSAALNAPVNLAAAGFNVVAIALQSIGTGKLENLNNASLITSFTPAPAATANVNLSLLTDGLRIPSAYILPATASAQVALTNPNLGLGVAGDGISVSLSGLPENPSGWTYAVYTTDDAAVTTRLGLFNSNARGGTFNFSSASPSNAAPAPATITDAKAKFSRVFVTLEPVSAGDGGLANSTPGSGVVLDNASSAWTFGAALPKPQ
jgi:hypothetical protein